ncbi:hypothetical protein A6046_07055 [[Haemophilus] ducreyi]|uniref:Z-ring associated protein G n=2 Tax=Haemophilus ducreyi TaxID=730 RepID=ZAPG_HAEDU|nr:YhcB family protein [[Haemophilus] ducreyi]Q7VLF5.1 RecName: Full=Z-ring associated protein G; AltName: Full=Cell division protein ZapG [[Haemophilus] ducreyi 35000HP]AAP96293.1 hypothetical protein HD_1495 [[Haemophilus] ducreyi 35000HP]AKO31231.1 membrane protein [[Haemophilus] ducreyi]AKO32676.1 membrane protein [[Haemophilus] ducreyi]AKO34126.1 membrane protein [[Haemophilus] ducreyi]AKO35573.1 membrane protein [[Haemophilus] ducreyi]
MEQWTTEIWFSISIAFLIGTLCGVLVMRFFKGNIQQQIQLKSELASAEAKIEEQKQQLERHFEQSANLLENLAEDYKKLYTHFAQNSEQLLPESNQVEFFKRLKNHANGDEDNQPRDYSDGSSGLLKS